MQARNSICRTCSWCPSGNRHYRRAPRSGVTDAPALGDKAKYDGLPLASKAEREGAVQYTAMKSGFANHNGAAVPLIPWVVLLALCAVVGPARAENGYIREVSSEYAANAFISGRHKDIELFPSLANAQALLRSRTWRTFVGIPMKTELKANSHREGAIADCISQSAGSLVLQVL